MEENTFNAEVDAYLRDRLSLSFTIFSYRVPMNSVQEKMKHDFLHQEK